MSDKVYIVIPTYNEKGNIENLLSQIFSLKLSAVDILVVDDNSPDGTGKIVEQFCQSHANLHLLSRPKKEGLGRAYIAGFKQALAAGADIIIQMDADLSHDPKYIPEFLQKIQECDLVLGSRYIKNGGIKNWSLVRRLISYFGNLYARMVLKLPYRDLTGGFKCYRAAVLEKITAQELSSLGYNFQTETTFFAHKYNYSIKEIPIIFTERQVGKSKFNIKIILEGFFQVLILRLKNS